MSQAEQTAQGTTEWLVSRWKEAIGRINWRLVALVASVLLAIGLLTIMGIGALPAIRLVFSDVWTVRALTALTCLIVFSAFLGRQTAKALASFTTVVVRFLMSEEAYALRGLVFIALVTLTIALGGLNLTGAWHSTHNAWFTVSVACAEILAFGAVSLIVKAPWYWKPFGIAIFAACLFTVVDNGKAAIRHAKSDVFVGDATTLEAKADLLKHDAEAFDLDAKNFDDAAARDEKEATEQRAAVRDLYGKSIVSAAQKPADRAEMLSANAIEKRTQAKDARAKASAARRTVLELTNQAKTVRDREAWLNGLLFGLEGARTFGLPALVMWPAWFRKSPIAVVSRFFSKGKVKKSFTPQEWADIEKAMEHRANFEAGLEKSRETRNLAKFVTDVDWARQRKKEIWDLHLEGSTLAEIAAAYGWSPAELSLILERMFSRQQVTQIRNGREGMSSAAE